MDNPLLELKNVSIGFKSDGSITEIVSDVSFSIQKGEIFGLVGESGCGKSVTAMSLLKLLPQPGGVYIGGKILFQGHNIIDTDESAMNKIRGNKISMIFQEPSSALNPLFTVEKQILECFEYHPFEGNKQERLFELMEKVGLLDTNRILKSYPHELSGGMLQRVMIAIALILQPSLIIADEPTTALDVTIQAQIMELLVNLSREFNVSVLLITHNLGLIAQYAHRLAIMYAGRIVEECSIDDFLRGARHPYTKGLMQAIPDIHAEMYDLIPIEGQVPQPSEYTNGCRFYDRCSLKSDKCLEKPELEKISDSHKAACFNMDRN